MHISFHSCTGSLEDCIIEAICVLLKLLKEGSREVGRIAEVEITEGLKFILIYLLEHPLYLFKLNSYEFVICSVCVCICVSVCGGGGQQGNAALQL